MDIVKRLRMHQDNKTKLHMQEDGVFAAEAIQRLRAELTAREAELAAAKGELEALKAAQPPKVTDAKLIAAAPELLRAASAALHYMRLHKYADQAWADDLEAAIDEAMTPIDSKPVEGE